MADKSCKILVVDDNEEQVSIIKKALNAEGYSVSPATSGALALSILEKEKVDVLVCDMSMPEMDGITLLKKVKEIYPGMPVIIITAFGDWGKYAEALREGAAEFLSKPFKMEELMKTIRKVLSS